MSRVYLVRHGQSEANVRKLWGGDFPLTALGREQAAEVPEKIGEKPDAVFSSCKKRAMETAAIAYPGYDIEHFSEFDEIFTGSLEETVYDPVMAKEVRNDPCYLRDRCGGDDLDERAWRALSKIRELAEGRDVIVIVSSDYLICTVLSLLDHGNGRMIGGYKMHNCDNVCIDIQEDGRCIR